MVQPPHFCDVGNLFRRALYLSWNFGKFCSKYDFSLQVLLVLEGRAHAYIFGSPGCKKWDTCAPEAILHAVGGKLTDIHATHFLYHSAVQHKNTGGVLATLTEADHKLFAGKIPQSVKDSLPSDPV